MMKPPIVALSIDSMPSTPLVVVMVMLWIFGVLALMKKPLLVALSIDLMLSAPLVVAMEMP